MTLRRVKKRSALPVLAALLVGSTSAGAVTMVLSNPDEVPLVGAAAVLAATSATLERAPGTLVPPRQSSSSTSAVPPTTKTPTPPATSIPPTSPPSTKATPDPGPPSAPPSNPDPPSSAQPDRVVDLVNQVRADSGCAALLVDVHLTAAAAKHSSDMSDRNYFSHTTPEGVTFDERIKAAGYPLPGAENIANGYKSAAQVMDAWMASPGHKANILNCDLKTIGVGLDTDGFYWTQDFGF